MVANPRTSGAIHEYVIPCTTLVGLQVYWGVVLTNDCDVGENRESASP